MGGAPRRRRPQWTVDRRAAAADRSTSSNRKPNPKDCLDGGPRLAPTRALCLLDVLAICRSLARCGFFPFGHVSSWLGEKDIALQMPDAAANAFEDTRGLSCFDEKPTILNGGVTFMHEP